MKYILFFLALFCFSCEDSAPTKDETKSDRIERTLLFESVSSGENIFILKIDGQEYIYSKVVCNSGCAVAICPKTKER